MPGWMRRTPPAASTAKLIPPEVGLHLIEEPVVLPLRGQDAEHAVDVVMVEDVVDGAEARDLVPLGELVDLVEDALRATCCGRPCVAPFSPQKVQWCFSPHQQPRADSKESEPFAASALGIRSRAAVAK